MSVPFVLKHCDKSKFPSFKFPAALHDLLHIQLTFDTVRDARISFQTHPNIDKRGFQETGVVAMKQAGRPFPLNTDVGVLKWRFQSNDCEDLPLISE